MDDAVLDRALRYLREGCEPQQAIIRARETLAVERTQAHVERSRKRIRKVEGEVLYAMDRAERYMLLQRDGYFPRQAKPRSMMIRPAGIDYGCFRLMVDAIPDEFVTLPEGTVRYFGSRMPDTGGRKRTRKAKPIGRRPERSIVRDVIAQQDARKAARLAKLGSQADYD